MKIYRAHLKSDIDDLKALILMLMKSGSGELNKLGDDAWEALLYENSARTLQELETKKGITEALYTPKRT